MPHELIQLDVDYDMNHAWVERVRIERPPGVSVTQWEDFWRAAKNIRKTLQENYDMTNELQRLSELGVE